MHLCWCGCQKAFIVSKDKRICIYIFSDFCIIRPLIGMCGDKRFLHAANTRQQWNHSGIIYTFVLYINSLSVSSAGGANVCFIAKYTINWVLFFSFVIIVVKSQTRHFNRGFIKCKNWQTCILQKWDFHFIYYVLDFFFFFAVVVSFSLLHFSLNFVHNEFNLKLAALTKIKRIFAIEMVL